MLDNIQCVRANEKEIPSLIRLRIAFLSEIMGVPAEEDIDSLKECLENYFTTTLKDNTCICWLALVNEAPVSIGTMVVKIQLGTFKNPSGKMGYIQNMYTAPDHRKKGMGSMILNKLIETGAEWGLTAFELHATDDGAALYRKKGFELHDQPTYRRYNH
jgi:GNAT superfamily N-acetyltransferase